MIIALLFFVVASTFVTNGLTGPTAREYRTSSESLTSKQGYFLAESGVEDAFYRLKNSMTLPSSTTITLNGSSATTTITDLGGGTKQISSDGAVGESNRSVDLRVATGAGISFNYGVQVGEGGLDLQGSGTVIGNVYANGPITGDSSGIITGTATSANSPALTADQSNGSGTPANNITFGNASSTQDIAQSFELATSSPINKIQLYIKKVGSPSNATVKIMNDVSGSPGTVQYASGTLTASTVTTSYGWIDIALTSSPVLSTATPYWIVVDASNSTTKYYVVGASTGGYASGIAKIGQSPSTWGATTPSTVDLFFKIYLGGFTGLIRGNSGSVWNPLHIGTVSGNAYANMINYTNVTGTAYCTSGGNTTSSGTVTPCTPATDPTFQPFPISDANIASWKSDASAGGIITGAYSVGWAGATLGPKEITGNLTVSGGGILTVSGPLYVKGNLSLSGGADIVLASSYGTNDGVIVVDGTISITGGGHATGSGTTGSYIMILTTNTSLNTTTPAALISGGAGAVIVYAPNGLAKITGGASLKEITAYQVKIDGGSTLTYETGLANLNFSSGPSGSYTVSEWKEGQ